MQDKPVGLQCEPVSLFTLMTIIKDYWGGGSEEGWVRSCKGLEPSCQKRHVGKNWYHHWETMIITADNLPL